MPFQPPQDGTNEEKGRAFLAWVIQQLEAQEAWRQRQERYLSEIYGMLHRITNGAPQGAMTRPPPSPRARAAAAEAQRVIQRRAGELADVLMDWVVGAVRGRR